MNDRHAWMIIVHNHPEQLLRLCTFLDYECNDIYIHIDKKVMRNYPVDKISGICRIAKVIILSESIRVTWGGYSQVLAELRLLEAAIKDGRHLYYHLLSGTDVPIKNFEHIYGFLKKNSGSEFVSFDRDVSEKLMIERYCVRSLIDWYGRGRSLRCRVLRLCDCVLRKIQLVAAFYHRDEAFIYCKGDSWFSITEEFAKYVISPHSKEWIQKYCAYTKCPDEFFMQTLLYNSEFYKNVYGVPSKGKGKCCMCLRYIDWERGSPYTFRSRDIEELMSTPEDALFARKFDEDIDTEVIDEIYQSCQIATQNVF